MDIDQAIESVESTVAAAGLTPGTVVFAVVALVGAWVLARFARKRLRTYLDSQDGLEKSLPEPISRAASWAIKLVGVLIALTILGFDSTPIILVILFAAAVLVVSGKGIMENFGAGVLLQIRGPFRVGDRIMAKDFTGTVIAINSRAVVLKTGDRRTVHVPNKEFLEDPIVNYSTQAARRSGVRVGVAYDTDLRSAKTLLVDTAAGVDGVHSDPSPRAFIDEFDDSWVTLEVQFWHADGQRVETRDSVAQAVKDVLDDAGIDMPFPHVVNLTVDDAHE